MIYDLDGFKLYNDTFGHPAGDALLARLAGALGKAAAPYGACYRLGGDEFCVLADVPAEDEEAFLEETAAALSESGVGFAVTSSFGAVRLPRGGLDADRGPARGRPAPLRAETRALGPAGSRTRCCSRRSSSAPQACGTTSGRSSIRPPRSARRSGCPGTSSTSCASRPVSTTSASSRSPTTSSRSPARSTPEEWAFIKEHTVIGQRILAAAPGWLGVGAIVRATHERWDGDGLPGRARR